MLEPQIIEEGIFDIPLLLSPSLEPQCMVLQTRLIDAQKRLKEFALTHGWLEHVLAPFMQEARIFADKRQFDHALLELVGMDTTAELPETCCAALEQQVLMSVSPKLYMELYPQGDEHGAFEKLLTHEMAHRLHIRILKGDEKRMGPMWFYEGFALYASNQFEANLPVLRLDEIWEIVQMEERIDYRYYAAVFRYFLDMIPLKQFIDQAAKVGFETWLHKVVQYLT